MNLENHREDSGRVSLFDAELLLKSVEETDDAWKIAGIASDESKDEEGEELFKSKLDLTYAKARGYINWEHSPEPEDQLGYLTKAEIIEEESLDKLKKNFPNINEKASIYVEGEFYKGSKKAQAVYNILKSSNGEKGLGMSVEGLLGRDKKTGELVKAAIHGVAITSHPIQMNTLVKLRKSLLKPEKDLTKGVTALPEETIQLVKSLVSAEIRRERAIDHVLKIRPNWNRELATQVVAFVESQTKGEVHG